MCRTENINRANKQKLHGYNHVQHSADCKRTPFTGLQYTVHYASKRKANQQLSKSPAPSKMLVSRFKRGSSETEKRRRTTYGIETLKLNKYMHTYTRTTTLDLIKPKEIYTYKKNRRGGFRLCPRPAATRSTGNCRKPRPSQKRSKLWGSGTATAPL